MKRKLCRCCQEVKDVSEFYNDSGRRDGKTWACKSCNKEKMREWRATKRGKEMHLDQQRRYRNKNRVKKRVHDKTLYEIERGRLLRPSKCSVCNIHCTPIAHHDDYTKPLEVTWLCTQCHSNVHRKEEK